MNEKELEMFKDLTFKITDETKELLLDMLYIKQMLNESELSLKDRKILIKEFFLNRNRLEQLKGVLNYPHKTTT